MHLEASIVLQFIKIWTSEILEMNNNYRNNENNENIAKKINSDEVNRANTKPLTIKVNGCAACHVLFSIVDKMHVNESEASVLLSQILFHDPQLNESLIGMVEVLHMKQRMMGVPFSIKTLDPRTNI